MEFAQVRPYRRAWRCARSAAGPPYSRTLGRRFTTLPPSRPGEGRGQETRQVLLPVWPSVSIFSVSVSVCLCQCLCPSFSVALSLSLFLGFSVSLSPPPPSSLSSPLSFSASLTLRSPSLLRLGTAPQRDREGSLEGLRGARQIT